jgi:uncharacterized metal-binding protein YceD (DUF177 family)
MHQMTQLPTHVVRLVDLPKSRVTAFDITPTAEGRAAIATTIGVPLLRKLKFKGVLNPMGKTDWRLTARLGTTAVQDCVVTLDPVTTRVDDDIEVIFAKQIEDSDEEEVEMTEDDRVQPLEAEIDIVAVMMEALVLSLPDYPRKPDVATSEAVFTEPGKDAMTDHDARPFAGLSDLRDALKNKDD